MIDKLLFVVVYRRFNCARGDDGNYTYYIVDMILLLEV